MGISTEMLVCEDMTSLPIAMRSLHCAVIMPSNSCYTVVASIFLVSDFCKAICSHFD